MLFCHCVKRAFWKWTNEWAASSQTTGDGEGGQEKAEGVRKWQQDRVRQREGDREVEAGQEKAVGLAFPPSGTSQGQFEP